MAGNYRGRLYLVNGNPGEARGDLDGNRQLGLPLVARQLDVGLNLIFDEPAD